MELGGAAEAINALLRERERKRERRVDHFGRGLQVPADRCNSSAINRAAVQQRWRNDGGRPPPPAFSFPPSRLFPSHPHLASPLISRLPFRLPRSLPLAPSVHLFSTTLNIFHVRPCARSLQTCLAPPFLRYPSRRFLTLLSSTDYPFDQPSTLEPSRILASSSVYYVRTNRAAHVGPPRNSVQPSSRARLYPPHGRVAPASLSPTLSQPQFSPGDRSVRR